MKLKVDIKHKIKGPRSIIIALFTALVLCILFIGYILNTFILSYQTNIKDESASHLLEVNMQVENYIKAKVNNDWSTLESIANSINVYTQVDETNIITLLKRERSLWKISDIMIYTEAGDCFNLDNVLISNDKASETIYQARMHGRYISIIQSKIVYTIPIKSNLLFNGSRYAAISIVQDLDSFIDNMNFVSFNGKAYIYLTQKNGSVISRLTHSESTAVYNIGALFENCSIKSISSDINEDNNIMDCTEPSVFLLPDKPSALYVVAVPINVQDSDLKLFYFVPETEVNKTMNGFSKYVKFVSLIIISIFCLLTAAVFFLLLRLKHKQYITQISDRDYLFNLIVGKTNTAFALLEVDKLTPLYASSNIKKIINEDYLILTRKDEHFMMLNFLGEETDSAKQINENLVNWDGSEFFSSSYIRYDSQTNKYFVMRIYPTDKKNQYVAVAQDVTEMQNREEALKNALVMANSANLAKTRFLSNMSHDIRTPMNAIINMTDFAIENIEHKEPLLKYLNTIKDSSDHLLHLINDILDMSRIESGQSILVSEAFDIQKCLLEVCEMVAPLYIVKNLKFYTNFSSIQCSSLLGDKLKLSQILINIVNNAIKFTDYGGTVKFIVEECPSLKDDTCNLRFTIDDNGIGIAPEEIDSIFEPFKRSGNSTIRSIEGTGLGLSICKSYITAMGGTINCRSHLGEGSTFIIELFFKKTAITVDESVSKENGYFSSFLGKRALVCEDNEINQSIAATILEKLGFNVETAADGKEALNAFENSNENYFDVIYMDIQMPIMDGYEATVAIRSLATRYASSIPIIAMTANVFSEDIEKARISGMNAHISKPISVDELVHVSEKYLLK